MDKQRRLVIALIIVGVVVLILAIILGSNYNIGPDRKSLMKKETNTDTETKADVQNYELIETTDKIIFKNTDYNYQFSIPNDWPAFDPKNLSSVNIFSEPATIDENGEIVQKGMQLYIHTEPSDDKLSLLENIKTFYPDVEEYEEVDIGNQNAIRLNNINEVTDRTVFFLDEVNDVMIQFDGFDLNDTEESDFTQVFDEIIDSVIIY